MQLLVDKKVIHAGTFNGYPLGTAAVKATLEILSRNNGQAISQMNEKMVMIHEILKSEADNAGLPLVIQGPPGCASYHVCKDVLKNPEEYDFEIMSLDIILNNSLLKNGILVSSISRMYPNISLNEDDVEWFRERVRNAVIETKEIYDEIV